MIPARHAAYVYLVEQVIDDLAIFNRIITARNCSLSRLIHFFRKEVSFVSFVRPFIGWIR